MFFLPTRGRPEHCKALIASMQKLGDVPVVAVMIDDDPVLYADVRWPAHWHIHVADEHLEMVRAFNELLRLHPNEPWYGGICDHARPETTWWDRKLVKAAGDWNIAYCADGWLNGKRPDGDLTRPHITGVGVIGGELVRAMGWMALPSLVHLYLDDAWETIGKHLGLMRYLPDVMVRTARPEVTGAPRDANHLRVYRGKPYAAADRDAFRAWELDGLLGTIIAVRPLVEPLVFACVKVGTKYSADHVNILADMIRRNVPEGFNARIVCLTDDPAGLDHGIDVAFCPSMFTGWWAKLFLFSPRLFQNGTRVVYFDLDTALLGPLDPLLSYRGPLALLRDFYRPDNLGSGVMLWRAGECNDILQSYIVAGCPTDDPGGDQNFIEAQRPTAQRLQDLFPGFFCSYKGDCHPYPPTGAHVVCFHGFPGPHEASAPWLGDIWKKGGASLGRVTVQCNTPDEVQFANVRAACARTDVLFQKEERANHATLIIAAGGPSLSDCVDEIRGRIAGGASLMVLNGAGEFLSRHGITADYQTILDARPSNAKFIGPWADVFMLASVCAASVIDKATAMPPRRPDDEDNPGYHPVVIFHPIITGIDKHIPGEAVLVGGGVTVGLTALMLAHTMGYRRVILYGYDSSLREDATHAYKQQKTPGEAVTFPVLVGGRSFVTTPVMYAQAKAFQDVATTLANAGMEITVRGDGLLPEIARLMTAAPEENAA